MNTGQSCISLAIAVVAILTGCDRGGQTVESDGNQIPVDQPAGDERRPLEHVVEFDGYTLRANVLRSGFLSEDMVRQYGIETGDDVVLLNLVILKSRADLQPVPVLAEVSAQHESLIGHAETIDMRAVKSDGYVSYIGTLNTSAERFFQIVIKAQPEGTDQPLHMNFEVHLEAFEIDDSNNQER